MDDGAHDPNRTPTAKLCEAIVASRAEPLGEATRAAALPLVLDAIAVAAAGSGEEAVSILVEHHLEQGGTANASLIGRAARLPTVAAAEVNGAAMHVLDFEPMWSPANHALSSTLPVALAIGERVGAAGADVLAAMVAGIEVEGLLRQASGQFEAKALRFHPPGLVGPLGAAVTAAHLLGLDAVRLASALGIAASRSGGLMANVGTMTKSLHCGHAAAAGTTAALLAARGFGANTDVLGAPGGLIDAFFPEFDPAVLDQYGPPYRVVDPGYAVKLYPSQYGTHFGIEAALRLRRRIVPGRTVGAARLIVPEMAYVDRPLPRSGLDGKFSFQYTVAAALVHGRVDLDTFTDAALAHPGVRSLMGAIELVTAADVPARFEEMWVSLEVVLDDGSTLAERVGELPGRWRFPPPAELHEAKVRHALARVGIAPQAVDAVLDGCRRFDELDAGEISRLLGLTAPV